MGFVELVNDLKSTTNRSEKEDLLLYHETDLNSYLLKETFDPKRLHNVTLTKRELPEPGMHEIEEVEEWVRDLFISLKDSHSSKENKWMVKNLMGMLYPEDQEVLLGVINKKLKMGVSIKTLNKVWPDFIDVQPIQLANKYSSSKKYKNATWFWSFKLDGVRIFCFRIKGEWHIYSRAKDYIGRELFTLDHWKSELEEFYKTNGFTYFEGEAYRHGWEFSVIQSLVFSTVNQKEKAKELMFYIFLNGNCNDELRCDENLTEMDLPFPPAFFSYSTLLGVKQSPVINNSLEVREYLDDSVKKGYEGIMLRHPSILHSPKRDNYLLKVKPSYFKDTVDKWDCEIQAVEFDDFTIQENGIITTEHLPVRLVVLQPDGIECAVGSGFKLPFRRWLAEQHEEVVGKTAEIEYCGIGTHGRMRFPVFQRVREDV